MAMLNITYGGLSADYPLDVAVDLSDADVRRIAIEVVRAGGVWAGREVPDAAFDNYVVDRFASPDGDRIYLRPKVPFGC